MRVIMQRCMYLNTERAHLFDKSTAFSVIGQLTLVVLISFEIHAYSAQLSIFTNVSRSAGVHIFRSTYGHPIWADIDTDGLLDVFISNHTAAPSLFRNNGDGTFTDIMSPAGIATDGDQHGAAWGDYDNDGDVDLFITIGAQRGKKVGSKTDRLYRNNGHGHFIDVTASAGAVNALGRGRSVNWVDVDNDGHLDLFIKNSDSPNVLYRNNGDTTFIDIALASDLADVPGEVAAWADYDNDGDMDLFITMGAKDRLWRNNGDGTFSEVTAAAKLQNLSRGQGVAWGDYDNDGHIDLFVARGYHDVKNALSWDAESILFSDQEASAEDGLDFTTSGDQVSFDLYIRDCRQASMVFVGSQHASPAGMPFTLTAVEAKGQPHYTPGQDVGFYIWKDDAGWHVRWISDGRTTYFYGVLTNNGQFTAVRPINFTRTTPHIKASLYRNNGDGTFTDVTALAGVGSTKNNRGAIWGDYDNDGQIDLYVVNSGSFAKNGANTLYRNNGNGTFTNVTEVAGVWAGVNGRGDGAAWGDFDNDGFLDLYVTNGWGQPILARQGDPECLVFGPHLLYRNNGNSNRWLKIKLIGITSNRDGIGAKVRLLANGVTQLREVNGGGGGQFFSQGSGPIHFGLNQSDVIDVLTIQWPSGITQTLTNIAPNQEITIIEESTSP